MTRREASLVTDYLAFDRDRRRNRPFIQAFAGFALLALLGGAIGSVPRVESLEAASVFVVPVGALLMLNAWRWASLYRRLHAIRAEIHQTVL